MKNNTTSAPTSPAKNVSSFLSRATSLTSSVTSNVAGVASRISSQIKDAGKYKVILVIDDVHTDWSKYFRGKRLLGEFDIRVEQCEFRQLSVVTHCEVGPQCFVINERVTSRAFRPDFLLVRHHVRDIRSDYTPTLLGLKYGGVPSINSIHSLYNFVDRPWIVSNPPRFPCVIKVGHAHGGLGKIKVENPNEYDDVVSVVACTRSYATCEPFIDSKCDIHIQKIGSNYKAFMRKSISGNWKTNSGSSLIEQCPVNERYKRWVDEVSELFNGLDIVAVEAVLAKDGKEYVYEVTGSQMTLMGETQEEDRRLIADLVCTKMQNFCGRPAMSKQLSRSSITTTGYLSDEQANESSNRTQYSGQAGYSQRPPQPPREGSFGSSSGIAPRRGSQSSTGSSDVNTSAGTGSLPLTSGLGTSSISNSMSSSDTGTDFVGQTTQQIKGLFRKASVSSDEPNNKEDSEDTMRNLRKTFAGIFGDM